MGKKACVIFTSANRDFVRVLGVLQDDLEACTCVNPFLGMGTSALERTTL